MIFAISDLHLSFSTGKPMDRFGSQWANHADQIKDSWLKNVSEDDLVILGGDTSWSMRYDEAIVDFQWIHDLPGKKVVIKGNHDYWWSFKGKLAKQFPSIHFLSSDYYRYGRYAIVGTRGWEGSDTEEDAKIYQREVHRLLNSTSNVPKECTVIGAMHYPPTLDGLETPFTKIFSDIRATTVIFGHIHDEYGFQHVFQGEIGETKYILTSSDYLKFQLVKLSDCSSNDLGIEHTDFEHPGYILERRIEIIERLSQNKLDKEIFVEQNHLLASMIESDFKDGVPFKVEENLLPARIVRMSDGNLSLNPIVETIGKSLVKSIADGIIKYNYLNTVSKKMLLDADLYEFRDGHMYKLLRREAHRCYEYKDAISLQLCRLVHAENYMVEAYPIQLVSEHLDGEIFEILVNCGEKLIMHSMNSELRTWLTNQGLYDEKKRLSLISDYVNKKIY